MQISACVFHRFTLAVAVYFFFCSLVEISQPFRHEKKNSFISIYSLHNREVCRAHRIWYVQTFAQAFWLWCYIERSPPFFFKNIVSFYSCTILLESKNKKLHVKQQLHFSKQTTRHSAHCFFPFIIATSVSFADLISVHLVNALSSHIIQMYWFIYWSSPRKFVSCQVAKLRSSIQKMCSNGNKWSSHLHRDARAHQHVNAVEKADVDNRLSI